MEVKLGGLPNTHPNMLFVPPPLFVRSKNLQMHGNWRSQGHLDQQKNKKDQKNIPSPLVTRSLGPLVLWSPGPVVRWSPGILVLLSPGPLVSCSPTALVFRSPGPLLAQIEA